MYNPHSSHTVVYCKDTKLRQCRDNDDELSLVTAFRGFQVFTSVTSESLNNLVTKDLATDEIENSLGCVPGNSEKNNNFITYIHTGKNDCTRET